MKILVLGAGNIGSVVALDLSREHEVTVVDSRDITLSGESITMKKMDVSNADKLREMMRAHHVTVNTLPGRFGLYIIKNAISASSELVDVSFMPENPLRLDANKSTVVVDAGFAPGLSNVLLGKIYEELGTLKDAIIRVGGLPVKPEPPLYYTATWSPEDLLEEYTRPARVIRNGKIVAVEPLEEINRVDIEGMTFEEFPSDGLRTLLYTIKAENMEERTLRWPGHLQVMKTLKSLGFLDEKNRECTLNALLPLMKKAEDFSIMEVWGTSDKGEMRFIMEDHASEFTSMSRVTGFTAAIITRILLAGELRVGIVPPEELAYETRTFNTLISELTARGVRISKSQA
ncbi:MAG: saccharopine dehydrogenase family protein [Euryarchaeota archaeon]|nr:saccharopine dehydrogenase family protein [Euryarchaeota archaeon]